MPVLTADGIHAVDDATAPGFVIHRYRPRVEGLFARIERWIDVATDTVHWRTISRDNVTTIYGKTSNSRVADPTDASRVFSWLIAESYDPKGNVIAYEYVEEDDAGVDLGATNERNRVRSANRYAKRIKYGNRASRLVQPDIAQQSWLFEVVFDYDEGHCERIAPDPARPADEQHELALASYAPKRAWAPRPDRFSSYKSTFEVRTYRRCSRILMFHRFAELGPDAYLVRSMELEYDDFDGPPSAAADSEIEHVGSSRYGSFMRRITQSGFVRDGAVEPIERGGATFYSYRVASLPALEFEYTRPRIDTQVRELDGASKANLPTGIDSSMRQWADLDGEGVSGVLSDDGVSWWYKPNLGAALGPQIALASKPSTASLAEGTHQLLDLAGDGQLDVVAFAGPAPGFSERTSQGTWSALAPFESLPNVSWNDPNLRFVDLTGDGHADVLVMEQDGISWYPSRGEGGFGDVTRVAHAATEESGPRLLFGEGTGSVYLADMSGDGLQDLVRVRNGEVCYWPSLGYGRFGAKVTMDGAPVFDEPDQFDQKRIRLADIDGSGATDLIYLHRDGVRLYFNWCGNGWSDARELNVFPVVDHLSQVSVLDLLGSGTSCLVWSSSLPYERARPLRYVDLMSDGKPHLLRRVDNNLGAETRIACAPSTRFYLADKREGKPWITRLPFPVHVVERVETYDHVGRNRFVTRYAYHHGHFDGVEREFRGFGRVDSWDTETYAALRGDGELATVDNIDAASHVPPAHTRTWFHTGSFGGRHEISEYYARPPGGSGEYYRPPGLTDDEADALLLATGPLPIDLPVEGTRDAARALKGTMLRQEIYALDGTSRQEHPYTVTQQSFAVRCLQAPTANTEGVYLTIPYESLSTQYERIPVDPRTQHALTLHVDDFGNTQMQVGIAYGRDLDDADLLESDQRVQRGALVTYGEYGFTGAVDDVAAHPDDYRTPVLCETRTYELTGYDPTGTAGRFQHSDFVRPSPDDLARPLLRFEADVGYEDVAAGPARRRLIEHTRTLYRPDDLGVAGGDTSQLLPLGQVEPMALQGESYRLAFTKSMLSSAFERNAQALIANTNETLGRDGGYVAGDGLQTSGVFPDDDPHGRWWAPGGRVFYSALQADADDAPEAELQYARAHFFQPLRYRDPFHTSAARTETIIAMDAYDLLVRETRDPVGNRVSAGARRPDGTIDPGQPHNDYRVLQAALVSDVNRNRTAVRHDALGLVAGTAVINHDGTEGDTLAGFEPDLTPAQVDGFYGAADPHFPAADFIASATARTVYDLQRFRRTRAAHPGDPDLWLPAFSATIAREAHSNPPPPVGSTRMQVMFSYSDGFGREIQKKTNAEPGPVTAGGTTVDPRWAGTGWTIHNNKGNPVRQYEPFFSQLPGRGHRFEFGAAYGVSPVLFYDPVGRVVATLNPDHTYQKVTFDSWRETTFDANDTVAPHGDETGDPRTDPDIGGYVEAYFAEQSGWRTWREQRTGGAMGPEQAKAASRAAAHADTPARTHFDPLGRAFITEQHNGFDAASRPIRYPTRVRLDIEGNTRSVRDAIEQAGDARGRVVITYRYDMLGNRIYSSSMEAGERWMLNDVSGKPIRAWDSRGHEFHSEYDAARRRLRVYVSGDETAGTPVLCERSLYGECHPDAEELNLRGQLFIHLDQAGRTTNEHFDFKSNLRRSTRLFARNFESLVDWATAEPSLPNAGVDMDLEAVDAALARELEAEVYASETTYDAQNRPLVAVQPHAVGTPPSRTRMSYNIGGFLECVDVNVRDARDAANVMRWTAFVENVDHDAHGRRVRVDYGNKTYTEYTYDPLTQRLVHLTTRRRGPAFADDDCPSPALPAWPGCHLQDLTYTFDPMGNITHVRDDAQQRIFFDNLRVDPVAAYTYDPVYRLIHATGREHAGRPGGQTAPYSRSDAGKVGLQHRGDGRALTRYDERYQYDTAGNILVMHRDGGWTRAYAYDESSAIEEGTGGAPRKTSNRLSSTTLSDGSLQERYVYDAHGNVVRMPQLGGAHADPNMYWDERDQLARVDLGGGGIAHYGYDASGQRVRKVWKKAPGLTEERLYLGGIEVFRKRNGGGAITLARETLHVMDGTHRIALVETLTVDTAANDPAPPQMVRYQIGNHLGSPAIELDDVAQVISYEEYSPYGSTTYQGARSQTETPKRYRYTGKERDEESGLYYHGARYYAPWLGRWTACDPGGLVDGSNTYVYGRNSPQYYTDSTGMQCDPLSQSCVNPSASTEREAALRQSLPEDERNQPAMSVDTSVPRTARSRRSASAPSEASWRESIPLTGAATTATEYYADLVMEGENEGGYVGAGKQVAGYAGGLFSVLWTPDLAPTTALTLGTAGLGAFAQAGRLGAASAPTSAILGTAGSYETGVSTVEVVTGETSGAHLGNLATGNLDSGRTLTTPERIVAGISATTGWATLGYGAYAEGQASTSSMAPGSHRWSQTSAGGKGRAGQWRERMREGGYEGEPIDAVATSEGAMVIDNTRLAVAQELGIPTMPVTVHNPAASLPLGMIFQRPPRFGPAVTWGGAGAYRTGKQTPPLPPTGSTSPPRLRR